MNEESGRVVLEELREALEDDAVELLSSYEVWVLTTQVPRLREARFAQQLHHQARTSSGLTYARSFVRDHGELDLCEIGNDFLAEKIEEAAARLGAEHPRLVDVPSRQVIALWAADRRKLTIVQAAAGPLAAGMMVDERSFEDLLGQTSIETADDPPPYDSDAWVPRGRHRTAKARDAGAVAYA